MKMEITPEQLSAMEIWRIVNKLRSTDEVASVEVLCDNHEPETRDDQCAVRVLGEWTKYDPREFRGETVLHALKKAEAAFDESTKDDPFRKLNPEHDGQVPPSFAKNVAPLGSLASLDPALDPIGVRPVGKGPCSACGSSNPEHNCARPDCPIP